MWATGRLCKPTNDGVSRQEVDPICNLSENERRKLAEDRLCKLTEADLENLTKQSPLRPAAFARKTYHTGGFTILDRCRAEQADCQCSAREAHQNQQQSSECIILDAADLITGYRIDVGVPTQTNRQVDCIDSNPNSGTFTWRGLMARKVVYGVNGSRDSQIKRVAPAPHLPVPDPHNLRSLIPRNLLRHRLQHHFPAPSSPAPSGPRVRFHAPHGLLLSPPAQRTFHWLIQPDISCASMRRS
jgi:hypothetical protein